MFTILQTTCYFSGLHVNFLFDFIVTNGELKVNFSIFQLNLKDKRKKIRSDYHRQTSNFRGIIFHFNPTFSIQSQFNTNGRLATKYSHPKFQKSNSSGERIYYAKGNINPMVPRKSGNNIPLPIFIPPANSPSSRCHHPISCHQQTTSRCGHKYGWHSDGKGDPEPIIQSSTGKHTFRLKRVCL